MCLLITFIFRLSVITFSKSNVYVQLTLSEGLLSKQLRQKVSQEDQQIQNQTLKRNEFFPSKWYIRNQNEIFEAIWSKLCIRTNKFTAVNSMRTKGQNKRQTVLYIRYNSRPLYLNMNTSLSKAIMHSRLCHYIQTTVSTLD